MADIVIPDFPFSGHFYPEILEDLIQYLRTNVPELTDEDATEPHIQLLRAYALSGHLNNVLLDLVANEMFLPTAKLRSSHKNLLALIDVDLAQASPATVDVVAQLTQVFTSAKVTIPATSLFSTLETRAAQAIDFEVLEDVDTIARTDLVDKVYSYDAGSDTYNDDSAGAQGAGFIPSWGGTIANGDAIYIGHRGVLWDQMTIGIDTGSSDIDVGVWEYYDGNLDQGNPSSVTNLGSTLEFSVNSILGTSDRTGTVVRVRSNITGAYADLVVAWAAGNNTIETVAGDNAFLGQTTPSTEESDYIIGTEWRELSDILDGSSDFATTGTSVVTFTLPQTLTQNWRQHTLAEGTALEMEAWWLRFRVISVGGAPTAPDVDYIQIHLGKQYQVFAATQGRSRTDDPLGSSDGTASQEFTLSNYPVIDDDNLAITVNEGGVDKSYERVDNFLSSVPTDRHFTVDFDDDGAAIITFGDGTNGKIPPAGVNNIKAVYRTMDEIDGNVGANTVTVNRSGVAYIASLNNPRGGSGYTDREGSTDEDLARLKVAGPASLRTRGRAVSPEDVELIAIEFTSGGTRPVARALAIEESFGPKTVECVVVGTGGTQVTASLLSEIEDFFNGTEDEGGVLVLNNECTVTNFLQKAIDVTATVYGGNLSSILTALTGLLNPLAVKSDGSYLWSFGGDVPVSRLIQTIMDTDPPPTNVTVSTPAADVGLGSRELPVVGTLAITVVEV